MGECKYCKIRHPNFFCPITDEMRSTGRYILNWLIDHKVQCNDKNCLCNSSTPYDALADLFDKTKILDIAEALKFSDERIRDIIPDWKGWND